MGYGAKDAPNPSYAKALSQPGECSPAGMDRYEHYLLYLFAAASQLMFLKNASMYRARSNW